MDGMTRAITYGGNGRAPVNSDGVPFDCSHVYASGNIAADMLANATAEASGQTVGLPALRDDGHPGMKEMGDF